MAFPAPAQPQKRKHQMEGLIDMNIRHGDYELRPYNDSCFCVYRVMP